MNDDKSDLEVAASREFSKVIFAGPTRVGKSSTANALFPIRPDIEYGEKFKLRLNGEPRPDDGKTKDARVVRTTEEFEESDRAGKFALTYRTADSRHGVAAEDAKRWNQHMLYLTDDHRAAMQMKELFSQRGRPSPITFLFYTEPHIVGTRLLLSPMSASQLQAREENFPTQFALFEKFAGNYLFHIKTRASSLDPSVTLEGTSSSTIIKDIEATARRVSEYIDAYHRHFREGMSTEGFHQAYVDNTLQRLVGNGSGPRDVFDLDARIQNGQQIHLDLTKELEDYRADRQLPFPKEVLDEMRKPRLKKYVESNGRHSLLLKGIVDPMKGGYDVDPEDILLDLIGRKLGYPNTMAKMAGQKFGNDSSRGQFKISNAQVRDGSIYSLGDQMDKDVTHPSLHIGFVYYKKGARCEIERWSATDLYRATATPQPERTFALTQ